MSCGELGPIEGGLIKDSTIQDSTIVGSEFTNGSISGSSVKSSSLENLSGIDDASARAIADAIAGDPLASGAISAAISSEPSLVLGSPEDPSSSADLPTDMFGSRDALLGQPAAWLELGGYVVPLYRKASNG